MISTEGALAADGITDTHHQLISSRRVEGTPVYDPDGKRLGTVRSLMINKVSGQVAYALLGFGGFLGLDEMVHPVPWSLLTYHEGRNGYVVHLSREQLERAPAFRLDEADRPRERSEDELVYAYYGQLPWWGGVP